MHSVGHKDEVSIVVGCHVLKSFAVSVRPPTLPPTSGEGGRKGVRSQRDGSAWLKTDLQNETLHRCREERPADERLGQRLNQSHREMPPVTARLHTVVEELRLSLFQRGNQRVRSEFVSHRLAEKPDDFI